jgi:hypothetical protein
MLERRRAPRIKLAWTLQAKVRAYVPARVVDVSTTGALLEVDHPLPPRTACTLRLPVNEDEIQFSAVIRRCSVGGYGLNEKGEKTVLYKAGVAFEALDPALVAKLKEHFAFPEAAPDDDAERSALSQNREALEDSSPDLAIEVEPD